LRVLTTGLVRLLQKLPKRTRAPLMTCVYGLAAGIVTVAFQATMSWLYQISFVSLSHQSRSLFLVGTFLVIMVTSLAVGWLLNTYCPSASGSGVPQLKVAFWRDFGFVSWPVVWVKFVAGILSIGGGSSLGREGPSVQLAGGLASQLAGVLGEAKQNRRTAAAAGAAAGLAAAFNTPLASVTFVLEEIIQDLNSRMLGSVLLAAVLGALVVHGLLGRQPAFSLGHVEAPSWLVYVLAPLVAAFAGISGICFQKLTLFIRARRKQFQHFPGWARPCIGGLITWGLGVSVFVGTGHLGVFSLGYSDLSEALTGQFAWKLAGLLLVTKLLATSSCYGFGGCGGIFSPTLFFGAMSGVVVAGLFGLAFPVTTPDRVALAVVGMSACLGAVVRAPVTGILIVFEMTHEFSLVPVLMLGSLVSQAVSYQLAKESFYDSALAQDGIHIERIVPPRDLQSWQQLPVTAIMKFQPVIAGDLAEGHIKTLLRDHPYQRFPVVRKCRLEGVLTRAEAEAALAERRPPKLEPAIHCLPTQTVRELQHLLIQSPSGIVVLLAGANGDVIGLVTLHDLLRAEVSLADQSAE
jgi:chloride channel protein, CIC family